MTNQTSSIKFVTKCMAIVKENSFQKGLFLLPQSELSVEVVRYPPPRWYVQGHIILQTANEPKNSKTSIKGHAEINTTL